MLDKFFAAYDAHELLLFEFFMVTGMREQEVIYATDNGVDFKNCTVSMKHSPQHGWAPKQYTERTIPCFTGAGRQAEDDAGQAWQGWTALPY
jgi:hypothetical protein